MPRIAKVGKSELHAALTAAAVDAKETNDCAVRAVAAATNTEYAVVHRMMAENGRRSRRGTEWDVMWETLTQLGFKAELRRPEEFISQYPGAHARVLRSVTTHHPDRFPAVWRDGKSYIMNTRAHVLAIVDGVNHDWTRGRAKRAIRIWEITKI